MIKRLVAALGVYGCTMGMAFASDDFPPYTRPTDLDRFYGPVNQMRLDAADQLKASGFHASAQAIRANSGQSRLPYLDDVMTTHEVNVDSRPEDMRRLRSGAFWVLPPI